MNIETCHGKKETCVCKGLGIICALRKNWENVVEEEHDQSSRSSAKSVNHRRRKVSQRLRDGEWGETRRNGGKRKIWVIKGQKTKCVSQIDSRRETINSVAKETKKKVLTQVQKFNWKNLSPFPRLQTSQETASNVSKIQVKSEPESASARVYVGQRSIRLHKHNINPFKHFQCPF